MLKVLGVNGAHVTFGRSPGEDRIGEPRLVEPPAVALRARSEGLVIDRAAGRMLGHAGTSPYSIAIVAR